MQSFLGEFLKRHEIDGFLYYGASTVDADIFYLSRFLAGDSFALLAQEKSTLLVSSMELGRAERESHEARCLSTGGYRISERVRKGATPEEAYIQVLTDFLREHDVKSLGVPFRFPVGLFRPLSESFSLEVLESPASRMRCIKSADEVFAISQTQRATERAMERAVQVISSSEPCGGVLYRDDEPLTSERVRWFIESSLLEDGCEASETIVSGGEEAAQPHAHGSGPLPSDAPIVIDIFPRSKASRYYADMTRTVLRGEPTPEVLELYRAVMLAQDAGLEAVRAGISGGDVHTRVSDVFSELGYREREGCGFTHSTGHGVGLDVHESPSLGMVDEPLSCGQVVTVEPGLYYPGIGGVRLEDLVVVREGLSENLTRFERKLVV